MIEWFSSISRLNKTYSQVKIIKKLSLNLINNFLPWGLSKQFENILYTIIVSFPVLLEDFKMVIKWIILPFLATVRKDSPMEIGNNMRKMRDLKNFSTLSSQKKMKNSLYKKWLFSIFWGRENLNVLKFGEKIWNK